MANKTLEQLSALAAADASAADLLLAWDTSAAHSQKTKSVRFDVLMGALGRLGNVFDVTDPAYGYVEATTSTHRTAIVAAEAAAFAANGVLRFPPGKTFDIGATGITIRCAVDGSGATITYSGTGIAVTVGSTTTSDEVRKLRLFLPLIVQSLKTTTGWAQAGGSDVGLRLANLYECEIFVTNVKYFSVGMLLTSFGTGCIANKVYVSHLENNKVNCKLLPGDAGGWVNENKFFGGWYSHESAEGTNVSGARQVLLDFFTAGNVVNNNIWYGADFEGNVPEYHVECKGSHNGWNHCRWEATTPKLYFSDAAADSNYVFYGYNSAAIVVTGVAGALWNHVYHRDGLRIQASAGGNGVIILEDSSSSSNAVLKSLPASNTPWSSNPATDWGISIAHALTQMKATADAFARIKHDHVLGRSYYGDASADPTSYFRASGLTILEAVSAGGFRINNGAQVAKWMVGSGTPEGVVTGAVGDIFSRTNGGAGTTLYVKESGAGNTGWVAK